MSLLKTKPKWFHGECIATRRGWENPLTNEVLVAIGNLKSKLELEFSKIVKNKFEAPVVVVKAPVVVVEAPTILKKEEIVKVKEVLMEVQENKKKLLPTKKAKVIGEVTEQSITGKRQIIAEVVEYDLDKPIIGE